MMKIENDLLNIVKRVRALAQTGLVYQDNDYDRERYEELVELSDRMTALVTGNEVSVIRDCFRVEDDYVTPKVDIRAVVFNDNDELLMVQEKADGGWSIPGGWADVGYSPSEVAVKEVKEETGLDVEAVRLLAILDKRCHPHPPHTHYAYKVFILCRLTGGEFAATFDILDSGFFPLDKLPPLSEERILKSQIEMLYDLKIHPEKPAVTD